MERNYKKELKSWIIDNPKSVVLDCNTIILARQEWEIGGRLGGGNFLMGIGLFAALGFLAKINKLLKMVKNDQPLPEKKINETDAFKELINDYGKSLGVASEDFGPLWDIFRNKLHHYARPGQGGRLLTYLNPVLKLLIGQGDNIFNKVSDNVYECNVDLLKVEVEKLSEWLSKKAVDIPEPQAEQIVDWVERRLKPILTNKSS